jgi:hypothetical protein
MHDLLLLNPLQASLYDESTKAPRTGEEVVVAILFHEPVENPSLVVLGALKVEVEEEEGAQVGVEAVAAAAAEPRKRGLQGKRRRRR